MKKNRAHFERPPSTRRQTQAVDAGDQALDRCANIRTLARLLEAAGSGAEAAGLEPAVVSNAGWLIKEQAAALRELVRQLQQAGLAKSRRPR